MTMAKPRILIVDDAGPVVVLCVNVLQALGVMQVFPTEPKHCPWLDEFDLQFPVLQTATSST